ncbi:cytochrome P450 [Oceanobacillus saliphilus]|uniref:cytochrome P450 n=1 Tax=Oceanobacillus saliphilus TaxID=2925834 RepID=UPI00201E73DD|nr:cytochrome P450 [Oceanobacillus saliphilus]
MVSTNTIPKEEGIDQALALLKEGYDYIPNRMRKFNTEIFETRFLGKKAICISGEEAVELFYDTERFQRNGVAPERIEKSLFGEGGVQGLDGEAHRHRKAMFMSLMTAERLKVLDEITHKQWEVALEKWLATDTIILFDEAEEIMCRVACQWAGVPLWAKDLEIRTKDLSAMIDAFGAVGPRHWQGRKARTRAERWIAYIIRQVRTGKMDADEETALYQIAWHEDLSGNLLDIKTAAVEVLNILRPIVAIGRFITFGAVALYENPEKRDKLIADESNYSQMFVQEVRRYFPFGPFLGASVKNDFTWKHHQFKKGTLVLLDIYGTNHDPKRWEYPDVFWPERFANWDGSPFNFIPQGGGDYDIGHRCAGEWITVQLMKTSLNYLAGKMDYDVPKQDLSYSMVRMPSIPKSRFVMRNIRRA